MHCLVKEKLLKQAEGLSEISKTYYSNKSRFIPEFIKWLDESERELSFNKNPIGILFQSEKSKILSVLDGYLPDDVPNEKNLRKVQRAVTARSLNFLSTEIYSKLQQIETEYDAVREKLSHAIAVLGTKDPGLYASLDNDQKSVIQIWKLLKETPETLPMYNYFGARLSQTDLFYLITEILGNIVVNREE